eukprot:3125094-Amphidinium_carterae.1
MIQIPILNVRPLHSLAHAFEIILCPAKVHRSLGQKDVVGVATRLWQEVTNACIRADLEAIFHIQRQSIGGHWPPRSGAVQCPTHCTSLLSRQSALIKHLMQFVLHRVSFSCAD